MTKRKVGEFALRQSSISINKKIATVGEFAFWKWSVSTKRKVASVGEFISVWERKSNVQISIWPMTVQILITVTVNDTNSLPFLVTIVYSYIAVKQLYMYYQRNWKILKPEKCRETQKILIAVMPRRNKLETIWKYQVKVHVAVRQELENWYGSYFLQILQSDLCWFLPKNSTLDKICRMMIRNQKMLVGWYRILYFCFGK